MAASTPQEVYNDLINRAFTRLEACSKDIAASHVQHGIANNLIALVTRQMNTGVARELDIKVNINDIIRRLDAWAATCDDSLELSQLHDATAAHMDAWVAVLRDFYDFDIWATKERHRRALETMAQGRAELAKLGIV